MRKIASLLAVIAAALVLTNCGGTAGDSDTSPFVGRIDFTASGMGMSSSGSMTVNTEKKQVTYRFDKIEDFLGTDLVMMVDLEKNVTYSISPSNKIYMKMDMPKKEMKGQLPTKEDVAEMKAEFFSKLKATGKEMEISGYTCAEYEVVQKVEGAEDVTIWVSKSLLDRIAPMWGGFPEIADLGIEEMLIGFPMKASGKQEGQTFSVEVTKITEGADALSDLDLSGMKELDAAAFMLKMMGSEDNPFGDLFENLDGMEGLEELDGLKESLENLEGQVSEEDIMKMMEQMNKN